MHDFNTYLQHVLDDVADSKVKEAMQYSLMAGGKRIRPAFLFATLEAYGIERSVGFRCAAAIEMIHTYSLIHDDLPAMDDDTLRRGKPTCHVRFDEATAILAGDALLTQAFLLGASACDDCEVNLKIVNALAQYSGANGMILGQIKDLEGEGKAQLSRQELQDIHVYKTGKLMSLPLLCASYLARHFEDACDWETIGKAVGLSFQIQDDILDVTSSVEILGKNINSDIAQEKTTYVSLMGIEFAKDEVARYFTEAKDILSKLNIDRKPIEEIFDNLINRKH